jgi:hypothetical protein
MATMITGQVLDLQPPFTFVHNVVSVVLTTVPKVLVAVAVLVEMWHRRLVMAPVVALPVAVSDAARFLAVVVAVMIAVVVAIVAVDAAVAAVAATVAVIMTAVATLVDGAKKTVKVIAIRST